MGEEASDDVARPDLDAESLALRSKATSTATTAEPKLDDVIHRWPTPKAKAWTAALLQEARRNEDTLAVVAIGSSVRPGVTSVDIDLDEIAAGNDLLGWAVKYGRALYQRDGYWSRVVDSWVHRLPVPDPEVAKERARAMHRRLTAMLSTGDTDAARELALSYATHLARYELARRNVYPASRPELPRQLREIGVQRLASLLDVLLDPDSDASNTVAELAHVVESDRPIAKGGPRSSSRRK